LSAQDLPQSIYEAIRQGAAKDPLAPALSFFITARTYRIPFVLTHGEMFARITQTANALRKLGIGREDVVAFMLPNLPETHFTLWGGSCAGRVLAIDPLLKPEQIGELLRAARAKILVTLEKTPKFDIWEKAQTAAQTAPGIERVLVCSLFDAMGPGVLPGVLRVLSRSRVTFSPAMTIGARKLPVSRLMKHIKAARGDALEFEPPKGDEISTLLCTDSATGQPKIACRTHFSEVYGGWALSRFRPDAAKAGTVFLCGLPLCHSNAILLTGLLPLMVGGHVVLAGPTGYCGDGIIDRFWDILAWYEVGVISGAPMLYTALADAPRNGADLRALQVAISAPMAAEISGRFARKTQIPLVQAYGLTEGAGISSVLRRASTDTPRDGSIGLRIPYQNMRPAVFNAAEEFERWAELGEVGVLMISGPNAFYGYLGEVQNKGIFHQIDGKIWFNTSDYGWQDADGHFWLTDRNSTRAK